VSGAAVSVGGETVGSVGKGYVALLGVGAADGRENVVKTVDKIRKLRIFPDENGRTNISVAEAGGGLLVISQFTLYADCAKGNRPNFTDAAPPALAEELYDYFVEYARGKFETVEHGVFGAEMRLELVNEGPFTVILDM